MKIKVSEATGTALDWLVAKCEGLTIGSATKSGVYTQEERWFQPTTDWAQGGPIIERERIQLRVDYDEAIFSVRWIKDLGYGPRSDGPTSLIAAMRCFVVSKLGEEVEVPDGLA